MKFQSIFSFQRKLKNSFGDEISHIRNELYFASRANPVIALLKALASLFRDLAYCIGLPRKIKISEDISYVFCVSLMGSSGWGALEPYFRLFPPSKILVIKHPRIKRHKGWINPLAPTINGWRKFFKILSANNGPKNFGIGNLLIRIYLARAALWVEVWKSTISQLEGVKKIILHNDFDMFSRGAVKSCQIFEVSTLCIQHGLPTDEFFPTSSNSYLVWGDSSARAFKMLDLSSPNLNSGRLMSAYEEKIDQIKDCPEEIALVSQTHTPIYGIDLAEKLICLSKKIVELNKGINGVNFSILLHPEECRVRNPYAGNLKKFCSRPPHKKLIRCKGQNPILVIGFCSTALIESARSGNFVLGLDWEINASYGAYSVGAPPVKVKTAQEILDIFNQLRYEVGYREFFIAKQSEWVSSAFKPLSDESALKLIEDNF